MDESSDPDNHTRLVSNEETSQTYQEDVAAVAVPQEVDAESFPLDEGSQVATDDDQHTDADIKEVDCESVKGSSKKGLQGVVEMMQETGPFTTQLEAKLENEAPENFDKILKDKPLQENGSQVKAHDTRELTRIMHKSSTKLQKTEPVFTKKSSTPSAQATKARTSSSSLFRMSLKTKENTTQKQGTDRTNALSNHPLRRSLSSGISRSNFTVPQPFALATDKRASIGGGRPTGSHASSQSHKLHRHSGMVGNVAVKEVQVYQKASKAMELGSKLGPSQEESLKPMKDPIVQPNSSTELKAEDDAASISSVGSKAAKAKASVIANSNGSSFSFKCDERAEKRKQFFTKLEELQIAKEEEKSQMQAKTKEEMEAEIKQLRKSLTFKATPMPTFYREGAPPKVELKKIPTTRAKSPKLGRRNNTAGLNRDGLSVKSSDESSEKAMSRSSLENSKKPVRRSLSRSISEKSMRVRTPETPEPLKESVVSTVVPMGSTTGDVDAERREISQEENVSCSVKLQPEPNDGIEHNKIRLEGEDRNSGHVLSSTDVDGEAPLALDNSHKLAEKIVTSSAKVTSADPEVGNTSRSPKSSEETSKEDTNDVKGSKTGKKERTKTNTPSFRLRKGDVGNQSLKRMLKREQDASPVVVDLPVQS